MDERKFEDGLHMLLKRSYHRVEPDAAFRDSLLEKLKGSQRSRRRAHRRKKILYLFSGAGAVGAAAAALALTLLPPAITQPQPHSSASSTVVTAPAAVPTNEANLAQPVDSVAANVTKAAATPFPVAIPVERVGDAGMTAIAEASSLHALDALLVKTPGQDWQRVERGGEITLIGGTELRTPDDVSSGSGLRIAKKSYILLDQTGTLTKTDNGFSLRNGCALVSLADSKLTMGLGGKSVHVPKGGKAFLQVEGSDRYAPGGAPAPLVVVLDGQLSQPVAAVQADGTEAAEAKPLLAGYVYHLYDTPTGIVPHRAMGGLERERFSRMNEVVLTAFGE